MTPDIPVDAAEVARARRERPIEVDGLGGQTQKFTIDSRDCYFTVTWGPDGRPAYLGMVVAGGPNRNPLLEVVFGMAVRMLAAGCADLPYLIRAWRGTHFEPSGVCPQLECIVSSPLDAVARYLERFAAADEGRRI